MDTRPIVVGVDGSEESKRALSWAADYAALSGAPLEALIAWETPPTYGFPTYYDDVDFDKRARHTLEEAIQGVLGNRPVELHVVHAHPATALVEASRTAQLLVVAQRGHGEFHDRLLGSVSQHCVHHSHSPVLVVRGNGGRAGES